MEDLEESPAPSRPKPSKVPSWIMVGFFFGALFVWALPKRPEAAAKVAPVAPEPPVLSTLRPRLSDVEDTFIEWERQYAVWTDNTTYVVMWDAETRTFRDCFQVLRRGNDEFFFRSVTRPRNLRPREDVPQNSPLQFLNSAPEERGFFGVPIAPTEIPKLPN